MQAQTKSLWCIKSFFIILTVSCVPLNVGVFKTRRHGRHGTGEAIQGII